MPNRILKESICTSDSIDGLSWFEEVLFYRLIVNCDDYGRFDGRVPVVKNRLFPLKDNVTAKAVKDGINRLVSLRLAALYEVDGKPYLYLPGWNDHQSVRAKRSKYPDPDTSADRCKQMHADVPVIQSESLSESLSESERDAPAGAGRHTQKRFTPPTVEEVAAYCRERGNQVDAQMFVDFYASKGWKVGSSPMKDWKAAIRTWEQREEGKKKPAAGWKLSKAEMEAIERIMAEDCDQEV